ncbi:MAG: type II CAAX endopeptidase family protein [Actinomycetaceae bacterium]|nr:type II CAAX endopeptidase family protein [Actinomycetaceae bacterium]
MASTARKESKHPGSVGKPGLAAPLVFLLIYVVTLLGGPMVLAFMPGLGKDASTYYTIGFYCSLALLGFFMFRRDLLDDFKEFARHPVKLLIVGVLGFAVIKGTNTLVDFLVQNVGVAQNQKNAEEFLHKTLFAIPIVTLIGPFVEEVGFRHALIGRLKSRVPVAVLSVVSVVGFAVLHMGEPSMQALKPMLNYLVIGLVITVAYLIFKKLSYALSIHVVNNIVGAALVLMQGPPSS